MQVYRYALSKITMAARLLGPPSYESIYGQQQLPANAGATAQQPATTSPHPSQMQNIAAGPGQTFPPLQAYPQPVHYPGSPYSPLGYTYITEPNKMQTQRMCFPQYITLPHQPDMRFNLQVMAYNSVVDLFLNMFFP